MKPKLGNCGSITRTTIYISRAAEIIGLYW